MAIEDEYSFGITIDGPCFKLDNLSSVPNKQIYDYFCNVTRISSYNGNGVYNVTIIDKLFNQGCPIGKWKLISGKIRYNWGNIMSSFVLMDENGEKTNEIEAHKDVFPRTQTYNAIEPLTRAIFSKAIEIVSRFQSSEVYNTYQKFMSESIPLYAIQEYANSHTKTETIKYFFDECVFSLQKYYNEYTKLCKLMDLEDERNKPLLVDIADKMYNFLGKVIKR